MIQKDQKTTITLSVDPHAKRSLESAGITPFEPAPAGVVLARLVGFADGRPLVLLPGKQGPVAACSASALRTDQVDQLVAVMFVDADMSKPMVIGPVVGLPDATDAAAPQRLELSASRELVLKCGSATLRLQADGTAVLRGVNVVTRAAATNRIRGGNVQIN